MCSLPDGKTTLHALGSLEARCTLFCGPATEVCNRAVWPAVQLHPGANRDIWSTSSIYHMHAHLCLHTHAEGGSSAAAGVFMLLAARSRCCLDIGKAACAPATLIWIYYMRCTRGW